MLGIIGAKEDGMKTMAVGELKTHFSEVLDEVRAGGEVEVLYGRSKTPVAKLVPIDIGKKQRLLGALQGKAHFSISDDWKMTSEELSTL
jgi:prevent-host-death family protein